jgi:hypothetical protein
MNGLNTSFVTDPTTFLGNRPVNVSGILPRSVSAGGAPSATPMIDTIKYGAFDISQDGGQVWLREASRSVATGGDQALVAYWCPFAQSNGKAGFVDIPKTQPLTDIVFTAAMNGCSLMVTAADKPGNFRLHHHQHPAGVSRAIVNTASGIVESAIVFEFAEADYNTPATVGSFFQTFNFLRFQAGGWKLYSQYTKLTLAAGGTTKVRTVISTATLDPAHPLIVRDVPMPA